MIFLQQRLTGCLMGLACGDAMGTSVEFMPRGSFPLVNDMNGGGVYHLQPGQWTDDTSMALCLAESLIQCKGFKAEDQIERYCRWQEEGYLSSTGQCFGIGRTVAAALENYRKNGNPFAGSVCPQTAGNGSLMRLAPVVLFYYPDREQILHYAVESSRVTHAAPEAVESCSLFASILANVLGGKDKIVALTEHVFVPYEPLVKQIAQGQYLNKHKNQIVASAYCVASLEASLWCFAKTDSFEQAVLTAVNLGDDADTTAAITGQIAGAYYGVEAIPDAWLKRLYLSDHIMHIAHRLSRCEDTT